MAFLMLFIWLPGSPRSAYICAAEYRASIYSGSICRAALYFSSASRVLVTFCRPYMAIMSLPSLKSAAAFLLSVVLYFFLFCALAVVAMSVSAKRKRMRMWRVLVMLRDRFE